MTAHIIKSAKLKSIVRVSDRARRHVNQVLDYGIHNTRSAGMVARLEQAFAERFGRGFAIAHCNGTATMHSALLAAGVGAGDEVIVPAYTVFPTAAVALHVNAVPVFADVDPQTWTIDPDDVCRKITPRTRAIIPVSICGLSPDMDPLLSLANQKGITVIEDNAQCFLGCYKQRLVGSMGDFSSFSFQGSKHMTCGDGGILLCDDSNLATRARKAATLGFSTLTGKPGDTAVPKELRCHPDFQRHTYLGYNYRLPELAAAYALGEFERLEELVAMRQSVARVFADAIADCPWLRPQYCPPDRVHSYWTLALHLDRDDVSWTQFRRRFIELGGDGFYGAYLPVYREPVMGSLSQTVLEAPKRFPHWAGYLPDYRETTCPVWERLQPRIIQLKTNYFEADVALQQAAALADTIESFR